MQAPEQALRALFCAIAQLRPAEAFEEHLHALAGLARGPAGAAAFLACLAVAPGGAPAPTQVCDRLLGSPEVCKKVQYHWSASDTVTCRSFSNTTELHLSWRASVQHLAAYSCPCWRGERLVAGDRPMSARVVPCCLLLVCMYWV